MISPWKAADCADVAAPNRIRDVLAARDLARREQDELLDHVRELAHVAGPAVALEQRERRLGERRNGDCGLRARASARKCSASSRMSSGRSRSGGTVELTTSRRYRRSSRNVPSRTRLGEVAVGGGDDAHVDLALLAGADRANAAALEHVEQLRLQRGRHLADLVEKQRAAVGLGEEAGAIGDRAGERAFDVAEQLALEQRLGQRRAVDRDEAPRSRAGCRRAARARPGPCRCRSRRARAPARPRRRRAGSARARPASPRCGR